MIASRMQKCKQQAKKRKTTTLSRFVILVTFSFSSMLWLNAVAELRGVNAAFSASNLARPWEASSSSPAQRRRSASERRRKRWWLARERRVVSSLTPLAVSRSIPSPVGLPYSNSDDDSFSSSSSSSRDKKNDEIKLEFLASSLGDKPNDAKKTTETNAKKMILFHPDSKNDDDSKSIPIPDLTTLERRTVEEKKRHGGSTIVDHLPQLWSMTRPANLPGVVVFYLLGVFMATTTTTNAAATVSFWTLATKNVPMLATLVSLVLVTTTSMMVNDYYDLQLGRDTAPSTNQKDMVPKIMIKQTLQFLYAIALFSSAMVPGVPARWLVLSGLILTFWYTQHLKPKTWWKNIACATLIALAPLTSGLAACSTLTAASVATSSSPLLLVIASPELLRLTAILYTGILGREITMDINDVDDDRSSGVMTVPVVHGKEYASRVSFACSVAVCGLAVSVPLLSFFGRPHRLLSLSSLWPLALAMGGGLAQVRRAWHVLRTKGSQAKVNEQAVNEGLLTVFLILASFLHR